MNPRTFGQKQRKGQHGYFTALEYVEEVYNKSDKLSQLFTYSGSKEENVQIYSFWVNDSAKRALYRKVVNSKGMFFDH